MQRFIGEDPIGLAGGDPNLYAYVGNSPTSFTDPFGFQGGPENLGRGWTARVDAFNSGQGFEIHVFNPKGEEVGICSGTDGWIAKHGHPAARPSGMPDEVATEVNGLNVKQLRARGWWERRGLKILKAEGTWGQEELCLVP